MFKTAQRSWDFTDKKRLFWLLQSVGWCAMMFVALGVLRSNGGGLLPLIFFRSVFGFLVTAFLLRPILRRLRSRYAATPLLLGPSLVGLAVLFGSADAYSSFWIFSMISKLQVSDEISRMFVNSGLTLRSCVYAFWISLYISINHFIDTARERLRIAQLDTETRESELRLLRAQVNPHFLFNALNTILAVADHPHRVTEITQSLADYLRFSLAQNSELHPLRKELDALENYLRVEKIRFEERIDYTLEVDVAARRFMVPGALVQPLLENAIKYGQDTSPPPLRLAIRAKSRADGGLSLVVENTGHWVEPGSSDSTGIGLVNLRRRLELIYGDSATLDIETAADRVSVRVEMPA
jgi:sensor histidine kinase YesM